MTVIELIEMEIQLACETHNHIMRSKSQNQIKSKNKSMDYFGQNTNNARIDTRTIPDNTSASKYILFILKWFMIHLYSMVTKK